MIVSFWHRLDIIRANTTPTVGIVSHPRKYALVCVVMEQWVESFHERVARAIKSARGARSAQWLADRTAELGYPITRAQIANYESGRKKTLDIPELVVLAAALNTSPVVLIYPGPYLDPVEVVPGRMASEFDAAQWFSGIGYWWIVAEDDIRPGDKTWQPSNEAWRTAGREFMSSVHRLGIYRRLQETELMRSQVVARGDFERDRDQIAFYDRLIEHLRQESLPDFDRSDSGDTDA